MIKMVMLILAILLVVNLIEANGLYVNQSLTNITKFYGSDIMFNFSIKNADSITFYNVSLEENSYINMAKIPELASGQTASINAIIIANQSVNDLKLRIRGFYNAVVGNSNTTYNLEVDYYNKISRCDFTTVKGDSVIWHNNVPDDIVMRNVATGNDVVTLQNNQSYTTHFDTPATFKYVFLRRGLIFTDICTITTLDNTGYVNDPNLDGRLNLSIFIIFNPTNLSYFLTENNYTLSTFQSQDGVLTVTNTGNNTAKNINLNMQWTNFNVNNFDLEPGQTKGIVYTMTPFPQKTEDTNKSYVLPLTISGNFPTLTSNFNLFVRYAFIGNGSNITSNYETLIGLLQSYCKENPEESFCKKNPSVIYIGNGSDQLFNVTYSSEQVKKIYEFIFKQADDQTVFNNWVKQSIDELKQMSYNTSETSKNTSGIISQIQVQNQNASDNTTFTIIIFIMLAIMTMLISLIYLGRRYKLKKEMNRW